MSLIRSLFSCVGERQARVGGSSMRAATPRIKFGRPLCQAFGSGPLPAPLRDLLVHIARDGVAVCDLFRRPGNPLQMRKIIKCLAEGRPVEWADYNFWTVANVAKRFLLAVPDGIFGKAGEATLLGALDIGSGADLHDRRVKIMHEVIVSQALAVQQLLALLFGIWFRMIYHTDVNSMSVEAVAKSVAGSMFHSCTDDPRKVERASKVMELLISGFASEDLFSVQLIEYFTSTTGTTINRSQLYAYEVSYPSSMSAITEAQYRTVMRDGVENYRGTAMDVTPTLITEYASLQPGAPLLNSEQAANANNTFSGTGGGGAGRVGRGIDSLSVYSMQSDITGFQRPRPPQSPLPQKQQEQDQLERQLALAPSPPSISTLPPVGLRRCLSVPPVAADKDDGDDGADGGHTQRQHQPRCCYSASEGQHQDQQQQQQQQQLYVDFDASYPQSAWHQRTPSGRFNSVKRRQLQQLAMRTRWFMSSSTGDADDTLDGDADFAYDVDDETEPDSQIAATSLVLLERPLVHSCYSLPPALQQQQQQQQRQEQENDQQQQQQQRRQQQQRQEQENEQQQQQQQQQQPVASSSPSLLTERRYFLVNRVYGTDSNC